MNPKIKETFKALNWPALSAKGMQHNVHKVAQFTVQMVQRTFNEKKRLTCRTLPRAAAIQGVRRYLVDGNKWYQIPVCRSPEGNTIQATTRCSHPVIENLTMDKEITSWKPKIFFGVKDTWEKTLQCNQKPLILWYNSEMCSSCGTCKYVCVKYALESVCQVFD